MELRSIRILESLRNGFENKSIPPNQATGLMMEWIVIERNFQFYHLVKNVDRISKRFKYSYLKNIFNLMAYGTYDKFDKSPEYFSDELRDIRRKYKEREKHVSSRIY